MRNLLISTLLLFTIIISRSKYLFAQAPPIEWAKCYGGSDSERANTVEQTSDGGYIIAGVALSNDSQVSGNHGDYDWWIVKIDAIGNLQWQKCLGGTQYEDVFSIKQLSDGGYIMLGFTGSNDGDITGFHSGVGQDCWLAKLDGMGTLLWEKCIGGSQADEGHSIDLTFDGGFVLACKTSSNDGDASGADGHQNYWIVKTDNGGNIQWQVTYGPDSGGGGSPRCIKQTADGGYIVVGGTTGVAGDVSGNHSLYSDSWVLKLDPAGNLQWQKCLGGFFDEEAFSVVQSNDSGYTIASYSSSNDGDVSGNHNGSVDIWITHIDGSGNLQWQNSFGGSSDELVGSIDKTSDKGYLVVGTTNSQDGDVVGAHAAIDYWVFKLDSSGTLEWQKCLGGSRQETGYDGKQTVDGGYIIAGRAASIDGDVSGNHSIGFFIQDYWIVKLASTGVNIHEMELPPLTFYPNPSSGIINFTFAVQSERIIRFKITDLTGRILVQQTEVPKQIDLSEFPPAIYFYDVQSEDGKTWSGKISRQ